MSDQARATDMHATSELTPPGAISETSAVGVYVEPSGNEPSLTSPIVSPIATAVPSKGVQWADLSSASSAAASANALETHSIGVELDAYASRDPHYREQGERPHRWSRVEAPSSERQSVADDAPGGDNTERDSAIVSLSPRNVLPGTITEHEDEPAIDEDSTYAWQRTI